MNKPVEAIQKLLEQQGLLTSEAKLACAVSGGADSMALLWGLVRLREIYSFSLSAIHIQHGLRQEESIRDENLVRHMCSLWGVPLRVRNANLSSTMNTPGIETLARKRRIAIFSEEFSESDALLTAHHRDDQSETVLMHLLRGAGSVGLGGMAFVSYMPSMMVLRPFLRLSKKDLLDWLACEGVPYCVDSSNFCANNPRNYIRLEILPRAEKLFPNAGMHIAENSFIIQEESGYIQQQAIEVYQKALIDCPPLYALQLKHLKDVPAVLIRRIVRLWVDEAVKKLGIPQDELGLSFQATDRLSLLAMESQNESENLPLGMKAVKGRYLLSLQMQNGDPLFSAENNAYNISGSGMITLMNTEFEVCRDCSPAIPKDAFQIYLSSAFQNAVLRFPCSSDVIRPFGAPGHKPLRRFWTDLHMDYSLRSCWPILALNHEVLWVPGITASELLRLEKPVPNIVAIKTKKGLFADIVS